MNFIDVLIIVPLIYAGYKGFKHGLVIEVFTLLALFVGLYAGIHFSDFLSAFLKKSFGWDSEYLPITPTNVLHAANTMHFRELTLKKFVRNCIMV